MDILLHTDASSFKRLEGDWNALLEESENTSVFSRWEYLDKWSKYFLGDHRPFVVELRRGGRPIGFAPLMACHETGSENRLHLSMIGNFADYCGFVVAPGEEAFFVERLLDLLAEKQAASVTFEHLQEETVVFQELSASCRQRGLTCRPEPVARAPYVAIQGDWDTYTRRLSRNSYRDLRKKMNRLSGTPGLEVRLIDEQGDLATHLEQMMEMHLRLWADREVYTPYREKIRRLFLREVGEAMLRSGVLRFTSLLLDGRPVAYLWCYDHKGVRHYLNAAWDREQSAISPGSLLLLSDLRDAFQRGMAEFDMLCGGEAYKYRYATGQRHVTSLSLFELARRRKPVAPLGRKITGAGRRDRNLLVIAHPDDEAIFFGSLLRRRPERKWTCCLVTDSSISPALREQRLWEFHRSCELLGLEPQRLEFDEPVSGQTLDPQQVADCLTERFSGRDFNAVYTHGVFGEYGHLHHAAVCLAVHLAFEGVYSLAGPLAAEETIREGSKDRFPGKVRFFEDVYMSQGALLDLVAPDERYTRLDVKQVHRIHRLFFERMPDGGWDPPLDEAELAEAATVLPQLRRAWFERKPCPVEFERAAAPDSTIDVFTALQCLVLNTAIGLAGAGALGTAEALVRELVRCPEQVMPGARIPAGQLAGLTGSGIHLPGSGEERGSRG